MRHFFIYMSAFCALMIAVSCGGQKIEVDLESILEQNKKDSTLVTGWYYIVDNETGFKRQIDKMEEFYFIDPKPILVKEHFGKLEVYKTDFQGRHFALSILIRKEYKELWANAIEKSIGKRLGLIVDNQLMTAPMVNMRIENGASSFMRKDYDRKKLETIKKLME